MGVLGFFRQTDDPYLVSLTALISRILHEPERRARSIALGAIDENERSRRLWQRLAAAPQEEAFALARDVNAPDLWQIANFIGRSPRGVVVTTIHGGDYLLGLLRLRLALGSNEKRILIVRKKEASDIETGVFSQFTLDDRPVEVVRHAENRALNLIKALRQGHIVVALFDLPASYGPTIEVCFLGESMHLVRGPAELAQLGRADVVPMCCARVAGQSNAFFHAPIRPRTTSATSQALAAIASRHIITFPRQWQHWYHVPEMLDPGVVADG